MAGHRFAHVGTQGFLGPQPKCQGGEAPGCAPLSSLTLLLPHHSAPRLLSCTLLEPTLTTGSHTLARRRKRCLSPFLLPGPWRSLRLELESALFPLLILPHYRGARHISRTVFSFSSGEEMMQIWSEPRDTGTSARQWT